MIGVSFVLTISVIAVPSAQAPAIAGRITDASGAILPGAMVTIVPEGGGIAQHTTCDDFGQYRFEAVPDGTYRIDFALPGFDLTRVNHVRIGAGAPARIDAVLRVGRPCEYPQRRPVPEASQPIEGQILDEVGRPLPHATVELAADGHFERSFTDREGRFLVRVPVDGTSQLTAYDSGFERVARQVSVTPANALVFRLRYTGTQDVEDHERLDRRWQCSSDLFTHAGP